VIHIGLAAGRDYFAIEKGAERDGYHEFPDEERKVVTRAEVKKLWGKSPARLDSAIDFEDVVERWRSIVKGGAGHAKAKGHGKDKEKEKDSEVKGSDDVGNYVCGFVYYVSLEWLWERKKEGKVLFLHVPNLVTEKEVERGRDITLALIKAVVESGTN
jgi:pyrrolidone-carboxylate peptidase